MSKEAPRPVTPIHIRRSAITDLPALRRLARVEERRLPQGTFLVAEVDGGIVAAAALDADAPPLGAGRPCSEALQRLLMRQARFLRRGGAAAEPLYG